MKRPEQMLSLNRRSEELGTACSDGEAGVAGGEDEAVDPGSWWRDKSGGGGRRKIREREVIYFITTHLDAGVDCNKTAEEDHGSGDADDGGDEGAGDRHTAQSTKATN
jgi:hypothetical protein